MEAMSNADPDAATRARKRLLSALDQLPEVSP